jgi:raffinose/stachyose/melibiose transport system permease protein
MDQSQTLRPQPGKQGVNLPEKWQFWRRLRRFSRSTPTYVLLSISLAIAVIPFLIIAIAAFKTNAEISQGVFHLPAVWRWSNIVNAWTQARFALYFRSSMIVVVGVVSASILLSSLSGYAFARMDFPLSRLIFILFLLGMMVPQESYIITLYYELKKLGLTDTYWGLILPQIGMSVCFGTFWMRGAFSEIPRDLEDAARVDGCTSFDTFWRVMLPLVWPAILTMAVLFFVWTWNDFLLALVIVSSENLRTLPLGLAFFQGRYAADIPLTSAGATIVSLPTIIIYFLLQRQFMRGVTAGAVHG